MEENRTLLAPENFQGLSDQQFAFEVVRNLGDSVRVLNDSVKELRAETKEILEKVVAIEAHSMVERIVKLEAQIEVLRIESLKSKGVKEAASWFFQSPVVMWFAGLAVAIYVWATTQVK